MDVRDRSNYSSSLDNLALGGAALENSSRLPADPASSATAIAGKDSSDLSAAAQAVTQTMQVPEIRQDRVTSLQQQISSGNYHVEAQNVADAMLRNFAG
jgi:flagellar biosynthesis anti-sigma factor FlgM